MALEAMLGMPAALSASARDHREAAAFGGQIDPLLLDDMDVQLPPFVSAISDLSVFIKHFKQRFTFK